MHECCDMSVQEKDVKTWTLVLLNQRRSGLWSSYQNGLCTWINQGIVSVTIQWWICLRTGWQNFALGLCMCNRQIHLVRDLLLPLWRKCNVFFKWLNKRFWFLSHFVFVLSGWVFFPLCWYLSGLHFWLLLKWEILKLLSIKGKVKFCAILDLKCGFHLQIVFTLLWLWMNFYLLVCSFRCLILGVFQYLAYCQGTSAELSEVILRWNWYQLKAEQINECLNVLCNFFRYASSFVCGYRNFSTDFLDNTLLKQFILP